MYLVIFVTIIIINAVIILHRLMDVFLFSGLSFQEEIKQQYIASRNILF